MRAAIPGVLATQEDNKNINTDVDATPTLLSRSLPPPPSSRISVRTPLRPRDRNVKMRVPPKGPAAGTSTNPNPNPNSRSNLKSGMPPHDKKSGGAPATRKPLLPSLATPAKTLDSTPKPPLTPRLAGAKTPAKTPSSQRKARPETTTPVGSSRKDLTTPVSSFLNNNITPRSSSRKSRADSTNTTPLGTSTATGTPSPRSTNRVPLRLARDVQPHVSGLGIHGLDSNTSTRSPAPLSPFRSDMGYPGSSAASSPADAKFFFASEAKSKSTTPQPSPRPTLRKKTSNSSFCYANGETAPEVPRSSGSAVGSMVGGDRSHRRLFSVQTTPKMHSSSASAVGSMVGGDRTHHRPYHAKEGSVSSISHRNPSTLGPKLGTPMGSTVGSRAGSMVGEDMPHHGFHSEHRPRGPGSALGSMVGSMVGSIIGSERSHTQFFHANGEPDETPDSPYGSVVGSRVGSMYGEERASPSFFHASDIVPHNSGGSAVGSLLEDEAPHPKFFYANGTPDLHASPAVHFTPPARAGSTVSTSSRMSSRMASPRLATSHPSPSPTTQRPPSPSKLRPQASPTAKDSLPSPRSPGMPRPQQTARGQSSGSVNTRRASIDVAHRVISHTRSISFDSKPETLLRTPPTRKYSGASSFASFGGDHPSSPLNMITHPVPISTPEEISEAGASADAPKDGVPPQPNEPIRTGQSIETLNELAAKARRERKVMDLEITNSSLEAINRTLEREMRKQTAELRRFRRLSRSGRLSILTSTSVRNSVGMSSVREGVDGTDDLSDDDDGFSGTEESDLSDEEASEDGSLSPRAIAESDARHRSKDEKRLELDLSKHQQLLVDSQKINQSLKRCLGLTEELTTEARKALEYHVRVSDVEFGGRVLAADEVERTRNGDEYNEEMSEIGAQILREARRAAKAGSSSPTKEDRDSGVELEGSQVSHNPSQ